MLRHLRSALLLAVLALVAVSGGTAAVAAVPAATTTFSPTVYVSRLVTLVNDARTNAHLVNVQFAGGTSQVAAAWTAHLAATQALAHNPQLPAQLETHGSDSWTEYGENVGVGSSTDPDALFAAYMKSPEHRGNILNPNFRYIGVAVQQAGTQVWNTMDFVDSYTGMTAGKGERPPVVASPPAPAAGGTAPASHAAAGASSPHAARGAAVSAAGGAAASAAQQSAAYSESPSHTAIGGVVALAVGLVALLAVAVLRQVGRRRSKLGTPRMPRVRRSHHSWDETLAFVRDGALTEVLAARERTPV